LLCVLRLASVAGCGGGNKSATVPADEPTKAPAIELADIPEEVLARVGDRTISNQQLFSRIGKAPKAAPKDVLDVLINESVLADKAKTLGFDTNPQVVAAADAARRKVARRLLEEELTSTVTIGEETLTNLFHTLHDTADLSALVLATEEQATSALERLNGGAKLADEAKHSLDRAKRPDGELGTRMRGQLDPAVADTVFSAPLGEFVGPVQTKLGWQVLRVNQRTIGDDALFEKKRPQLIRFAEKSLAREVRAHFLQGLRADHPVELDLAFLDQTEKRTTASAEELEHVVATSHGRPLRYRAVFQQLLAVSRGRASSHTSGPGMKRSLALELIDLELLADAAIERGFGDAPAAVAAAERAERAAMTATYAAQLRSQAIQVTPVQVEAYYKENASAFERPARRSVAHILVRQAELAKQLHKQLVGGGDFAELALEYSIDSSSARNGGEVGELADDRLRAIATAGEPALAKAIASATPGQITKPVKGNAGWHLIRISNYQPASPIPFDEVRARLTTELQARQANRALTKHITALRAQATIAVEAAAVERAERHIEQARVH
jgi:parvulin-like peptidyl-prolyl isomerase